MLSEYGPWTIYERSNTVIAMFFKLPKSGAVAQSSVRFVGSLGPLYKFKGEVNQE